MQLRQNTQAWGNDVNDMQPFYEGQAWAQWQRDAEAQARANKAWQEWVES
jgi:hypothetical protein